MTGCRVYKYRVSLSREMGNILSGFKAREMGGTDRKCSNLYYILEMNMLESES